MEVSGEVFLTARTSHHLIPDGHVQLKIKKKKEANITVSIMHFPFNILNILRKFA